MAAKRATFELFVRKMPANRAYLVFAGLEQAIGDLLRLAFSPEQIEAIRRWPEFRPIDPAVMDALAAIRFEGDVWAVPEGTVVFPGETLLRVDGAAAPGAMGRDLSAGLARLSDPGGVEGGPDGRRRPAAGRSTSSAPGGGTGRTRACSPRGRRTSRLRRHEPRRGARLLGIPASGTMAHSWVQSFPDEPAAFAAFARVFGETPTLLVDTYDTLEGVTPRRGDRAAGPGHPASTAAISRTCTRRRARSSMSAAGRASRSWPPATSTNTGSPSCVESGAPVDGFGVGTELITSRDAPALAMVYKLVELDGQGKFKLSPARGRTRWPSRSIRRRDAAGRFCGDHVTRADETAEGEPLLVPILRAGRLVGGPCRRLGAIRGALPRPARRAARRDCWRWTRRPDYPITYSDALEADARRLMVQADRSEN